MVDPLSGYGRKILDGISRYAHQKSNWRISFFDRERKELADLVETWEGDGIICTAVEPRFVEAAAGRTIPMVNVTGRLADSAFINVIGDDRSTGIEAAKFLLGRGFKSFAFVRRRDQSLFSLERGRGFSQEIAAAGFPCEMIVLGASGDEELAQAISQLPRPLAIAGAGDRQASMVIEACWKLGLHVPEEVAVLGIGNYEQLCELSSPTLSSVDVNMELRGYEAARILDEILEGAERPEASVLIPPAHVVERNSSDVYAFEDKDVVAALRFIRDHAAVTIKVRDVVAATSISRRSLEGRFNKLIGRTLHDEIWQAHFDLAGRLLSSSDLSLQEVAQRSGFRTASALVNLFRQRFSVTPKEYRVANRR